MSPPREASDDPTVHGLGVALLDAVDATQDLVIAQVALTKAELRSDAARIARGTVLLFVGVGAYALGHGALALAVGLALARIVDPVLAIALVGLPHALFGALGVALAARHLATIADPENL